MRAATVGVMPVAMAAVTVAAMRVVMAVATVGVMPAAMVAVTVAVTGVVTGVVTAEVTAARTELRQDSLVSDRRPSCRRFSFLRGL